MDYDVIIVGAGISGLYAAKLLKDCGLNILVLEGRNRVAGRQWTYRADNIGHTDMGGAYIGKQQTKVLAVLEELGLKTYKVTCDLKSTLSLKSGLQHYESGIPSFKNILILMDLNHCVRLTDKLSLEVPIDAPWEAEKAEIWDALTVKEFQDRNFWTKEAKALGEMSVMAAFGVQSSQMSLLYFLHEVRCGGGLVALTSISDGLQANRVIFSVPISGLFDIEFSPALPKYISQLCEEKPLCHMFKTFMFYDRAFWRDHGLNGELVSETGIVTYAVDDTKPDGSHPMILGFIDADKAKKYSTLSPDERKALICEQYSSCFELEEFLHPTHYLEKYWQSESELKYGRGCCVWSLPPGVLTRVRKFVSPMQPFGNIFFTGTEAALTFKGYMDGALRSAHCAAAQVSKSLGLQLDYNEAELSAEVPFLQPSTLEKYLPTPLVFVMCTVVCLVVLLLAVGLVLYFTLS